MFTRCHQCGYENGPNYRFCGMCGAPLESAAPAKVPAGAPAGETKPAPVSGPSFLGLAEEPRRDDLEYLLEDDEPRSSHWRLYLALGILVVAGMLLWARWRQYGYPWTTQSTASATAGTPSDQAQKPETIPPAPVLDGAAAPRRQPPALAPSIAEVAPAASPNGASPGANPPATKTQGGSAATAGGQETGTASSSRTETPPPTPAPKATPKATPAAPSAPAVSADDRLVSEGEKYLYGNGVAADCDRATKNLNMAAMHSNARAQSLLGAMYATGHCASRDLPTAYRWFAKALHNDPTNVRLESDLQMVWNQMTPGERSLATRAGQ